MEEVGGHLSIVDRLVHAEIEQLAPRRGLVESSEDRANEIVFNCVGKYCPYSAYACAKAVIWGYTRVYYFAGGFPAWKDAGYPVETSSTPVN